jgi:hypothetical protein
VIDVACGTNDDAAGGGHDEVNLGGCVDVDSEIYSRTRRTFFSSSS